MKALLYVMVFLLWLNPITAYGIEDKKADPYPDGPKVIERVIKIEGTLERPRVIFIVPRANVWKEYIFKKSFIPDILRPVYPESSIKE